MLWSPSRNKVLTVSILWPKWISYAICRFLPHGNMTPLSSWMASPDQRNCSPRSVHISDSGCRPYDNHVIAVAVAHKMIDMTANEYVYVQELYNNGGKCIITWTQVEHLSCGQIAKMIGQKICFWLIRNRIVYDEEGIEVLNIQQDYKSCWIMIRQYSAAFVVLLYA